MESKDGWKIELTRNREGRKVFYSYTDPGFSINNMPLNEVEINQLQSAADILSQFKGMPQFEWVNELVPKLKQGMASKEAAATIIEFDNNQYCLSPLNSWTEFKNQFSTLNLGCYEKRTS